MSQFFTDNDAHQDGGASGPPSPRVYVLPGDVVPQNEEGLRAAIGVPVSDDDVAEILRQLEETRR